MLTEALVQFDNKRKHLNKRNPTSVQDLNCVTMAFWKVTVSPVHTLCRLPGEQREDLYLQCDLQPDAIYSNDVVCDPSALPDLGGEEEDVYIVPDTL